MLYPYIRKGDGWNIDSNYFYYVWSLLDYKSIFYDGSITSPEDFILYLQADYVRAYLICSETDIVGIGWITNIDYAQNTAQAHFSFFKINKEIVRIGRESIRELFNYGFNCITGITPITNTFACKWLKVCGMNQLGVIPRYCYSYYDNKYVDGIISYIHKSN